MTTERSTSATTDTPNTSGEGVDVLDQRIYEGRASAQEGAEARCRIAALIVAVGEYLINDHSFDSLDRVARAYEACRATQGANR